MDGSSKDQWLAISITVWRHQPVEGALISYQPQSHVWKYEVSVHQREFSRTFLGSLLRSDRSTRRPQGLIVLRSAPSTICLVHKYNPYALGKNGQQIHVSRAAQVLLSNESFATLAACNNPRLPNLVIEPKRDFKAQLACDATLTNGVDI
jgi:hypothetical protein